ncbi:hypothetical protein DFH06DRAFT_1131912 [Mycena polygramma]|nr:hypothetical protein DFH06DRAFT_1131912 [Mycena polygramma]
MRGAHAASGARELSGDCTYGKIDTEVLVAQSARKGIDTGGGVHTVRDSARPLTRSGLEMVEAKEIKPPQATYYTESALRAYVLNIWVLEYFMGRDSRKMNQERDACGGNNDKYSDKHVQKIPDPCEATRSDDRDEPQETRMLAQCSKCQHSSKFHRQEGKAKAEKKVSEAGRKRSEASRNFRGSSLVLLILKVVVVRQQQLPLFDARFQGLAKVERFSPKTGVRMGLNQGRQLEPGCGESNAKGLSAAVDSAAISGSEVVWNSVSSSLTRCEDGWLRAVRWDSSGTSSIGEVLGGYIARGENHARKENARTCGHVESPGVSTTGVCVALRTSIQSHTGAVTGFQVDLRSTVQCGDPVAAPDDLEHTEPQSRRDLLSQTPGSPSLRYEHSTLAIQTFPASEGARASAREASLARILIDVTVDRIKVFAAPPAAAPAKSVTRCPGLEGHDRPSKCRIPSRLQTPARVLLPLSRRELPSITPRRADGPSSSMKVRRRHDEEMRVCALNGRVAGYRNRDGVRWGSEKMGVERKGKNTEQGSRSALRYFRRKCSKDSSSTHSLRVPDRSMVFSSSPLQLRIRLKNQNGGRKNSNECNIRFFSSLIRCLRCDSDMKTSGGENRESALFSAARMGLELHKNLPDGSNAVSPVRFFSASMQPLRYPYPGPHFGRLLLKFRRSYPLASVLPVVAFVSSIDPSVTTKLSSFFFVVTGSGPISPLLQSVAASGSTQSTVARQRAETDASLRMGPRRLKGNDDNFRDRVLNSGSARNARISSANGDRRVAGDGSAQTRVKRRRSADEAAFRKIRERYSRRSPAMGLPRGGHRGPVPEHPDAADRRGEEPSHQPLRWTSRTPAPAEAPPDTRNRRGAAMYHPNELERKVLSANQPARHAHRLRLPIPDTPPSSSTINPRSCPPGRAVTMISEEYARDSTAETPFAATTTDSSSYARAVLLRATTSF